MGPPASRVRQAPTASKFSSASPIGIHGLVAARAHGVGAMLHHLLAHGERLLSIFVLLEHRNIGRRRRHRHPQDIFQNPLAADHRRRSLGVRGQRQDAALSQQSAAEIVVQSDAAELASVNPGDSVMPRQPFVEERIVRRQKIQHAAILVEDALEEQLGLALECLAEVVVEIREIVRVGQDVAHIPQAAATGRRNWSPARATSGRATCAAACCRSTAGSCSLPALASAEQLVVRNAAPQKEGQTRSQIQIVDSIDGSGSRIGRIFLGAQNELRTGENTLQRQFDPGIETAVAPAGLVEAQNPRKIRIAHGLPIRPAGQRRENLPRAGHLADRLVRAAHEDPAPAGSIARTSRIKRTGDR